MIKIPGSELAQKILAEVEPKAKGKSLRIILASDDAAARTFTKLKKDRAAAIGIDCEIIEVENYLGEIPDAGEVSAEYDNYIASVISTVSGTSAEHPTIVQLPLHPALEPHRRAVLDAINPETDVDGLTEMNLRKVFAGDITATPPATVSAIFVALEFVAKQEGMNLRELVKEKRVVIVNDSDLIGKPLAAMLEQMNADVIICNKYTLDLAAETNQADILVSATGNVGLIAADMVKPGTIGIDVGSMKTDAGVRGDFAQTDEMFAKLLYFTPVPGGIGPLTIACLLQNVV